MLNHAKMIITCPECATRYQIDASSFPDEGRDVKCTSCANIWFQDFESLTPAELPLDTQDSETPVKSPEFAKPAPDQSEDQSHGEDEESDFDGDMSQEIAPEELPETKTSLSIEQEASRLMKSAQSLKSEKKRDQSQKKSAATKFILLVCSFIILGALAVKYRVPVVKKVPETAFIYNKVGLPVNIRGLEFAGVEAVRDFQNGIPVLAIEGEILNVTSKVQNLSSLRYALYNDSAQEVYHWVVPLQFKTLGPNTSVPIAARLAAPPAEASKLEVRFVRPQD